MFAGLIDNSTIARKGTDVTQQTGTPAQAQTVTDEDIGMIALDVGFMLSTAYGQETPKLMPVSDTHTLIAFARRLLSAHAQSVQEQSPLITVEASLRFQLECAEHKLKQAEDENRELRGKLQPVQTDEKSLLFAAHEILDICQRLNAGESIQIVKDWIKRRLPAQAIPAGYVQLSQVTKWLSFTCPDIRDEFLKEFAAAPQPAQEKTK